MLNMNDEKGALMDRIACAGFFLWLRRRCASEGWGHDLRTWCFSPFFGPTSPADVSCHVVAALPVPLGQRVCHSAVPGHFLRHHPAAPWSEARPNHRPHDRWVSPSLLCLPKRFLSSSEGNQGIIYVFFYCWPVNERALCTAALTPWPLFPPRSTETDDAHLRPASPAITDDIHATVLPLELIYAAVPVKNCPE